MSFVLPNNFADQTQFFAPRPTMVSSQVFSDVLCWVTEDGESSQTYCRNQPINTVASLIHKSPNLESKSLTRTSQVPSSHPFACRLAFASQLAWLLCHLPFPGSLAQNCQSEAGKSGDAGMPQVSVFFCRHACREREGAWRGLLFLATWNHDLKSVVWKALPKMDDPLSCRNRLLCSCKQFLKAAARESQPLSEKHVDRLVARVPFT